MFKELGTLAKESQEIQEKLRKAAQNTVKPALKSAITELIGIVPSLTAVRWDQYTPYFNDGDTCEFSVHSPEYQLDEDFVDTYSLDDQDLNKTQLEAIEKFEDNLGEIHDLLEEAFGDHTTVTVTSKGIETDECSHD